MLCCAHWPSGPLALFLTVPTLALADDWLFATNSNGGGAQGVRLTLSTKTVDSDTDVPCVSSPSEVDWSPGTTGTSWGLATNRTYRAGTPFVWAGIKGDSTSVWCSASSGYYCIGAAAYDTGAETLGRYEHPTWTSTSAPQVVDLVADDPAVVLLEKQADTVNQFEPESTVATFVHTGADEPTQIEWVSDDLFLLTNAGSNITAQQCETGQSSSDGTVWLSALGRTTPIEEETPSGERIKPEGVDVAFADRFNSGGCDLWEETPRGTYKVAYVVDFCQSVLYVYGVRRFAASGNKVVLASTVDLDLDVNSDASDHGSYCHPSAVAWHPGEQAVYVVCQQRGSIIRLDAQSDHCDPSWDKDTDEVLLQYAASASDCSTTPSLTDCGANCGPHDVAFRGNVHPGFVFVNLTDRHELVAVRTDLSDQYSLYYDSSAFKPQELELVKSDPAD